MRKALAWVAALCVSVLLAGWACAQAPDTLAQIPELTVTTYDVSGHSIDAIRQSIETAPARPRDPKDGPMDASASWQYRWQWPEDGHGRCDLSRVEVTFSATVMLPRLVSSPPPAVLQLWASYIAGLREHEAGHLSFARSRKAEIIAAIKSSSCATANAAANRVLDKIRAHDRQFDRETDHGRASNLAFP